MALGVARELYRSTLGALLDMQITFRKGEPDAPVRTPDSLFSEDTIEAILAVSQGPINGLRRGAKDFLVDDTPLAATDGSANFKQFELTVFPGGDPGAVITSRLGGFSSSTAVGVELAKDVPVVRSGTHTGITALDFRLRIGALYNQTQQGIFKTNLRVKFEYRKASDSDWTPAWVASAPSPPNYNPALGEQYNVVTSGGLGGTYYTFPQDRSVIIQTNTPTAPLDPKAWWLDSDDGFRPRKWNGSSWTGAASSLFGVWTMDGLHVVVRDRKPSGMGVGDIWVNSETFVALIWNGSAYVAPGSTYATNGAGHTSYTNGILDLTEKVSSAAAKEIRVFVPVIDEPYDLRVTKLSTDATTEIASSVVWESFQEVVNTAYQWKNLAVAQVVGKATDQFTSMPTFNGIWEGMIVKVPSNYNTETRVYTGVWDGTWQLKYTNNPAFLFKWFVENDEVGLSALYPHYTVDAEIYTWGVWCDTMVSDGKGGYRPRWTMNDYIQEPRNARDMARYLAGAAGAAYFDDDNGNVSVIVDKDDDPVALFTRENTIDGFSYSFTDSQTRPNYFNVTFINEDLEWSEDHRVVKNDASIAAVGMIPTDFIAVGCTSVAEAEARARYRLATGLTEKTIVTFRTNRKGKYLKFWDIILIADRAMGFGASGRIKTKVSSTEVTLRDPVSLEPGVDYVARFEYVSGAKLATIEVPITSDPGVVTTLEFGSALPANLPELAVFTLEAADETGYPKPFRITRISPSQESDEIVLIEALEVNRLKMTYVDGGTVALDEIQYSNLNDLPNPPTDLTVDPVIRMVGSVPTRTLFTSWTKSTTAMVKAYTVQHRVNGQLVSSNVTRDTFVDLPSALEGLHTIEVRGQHFISQRLSTPAIYTLDLTGLDRHVDAVTDLEMPGGGTTFSGASAIFQWDDNSIDPLFSFYRVRVFASPSNELLRTETQITREFIYDYDKITVDGLHRSFKVEVTRVDSHGNLSDPVSITVSNPAPALPLHDVKQGFAQIQLLIDDPLDFDFAGFKVWSGTSPGFPVDEDHVVWRGLGKPVIYALPSGETLYYRYAAYDAFGETFLNVSPEHTYASAAVVVSDEIENRIGALENVYPLFPYVGAHGSLLVTANVDSASSIEISAGYFDHSELGEIEVEETWFATPWGSLFAPKNGWFAIIWSEEPTSERFENFAGEGHFFPATYEGGAWKAYRQDRNGGETFTPRDTDVVIGRAIKPLQEDSTELSSADGVTEVINLVRDTAVVNSKIETVQSTLGDPADPASPIGSIFARWKHIVNTLADETLARVTAIETLTASMNLNDAVIESIQTAQVSFEEAFATYQTTVSAALSGKASTSSVTTVADAVAALDTAFSAYQLTVTAELAGKASTSSVSVVAGAIADLDTAFSTYQLAVTASLEDVEAAVTENADAIVSLDGRVSAFWGVEVNAGTGKAKIKAMAPGGTAPTTVELDADQIKVRGAAIFDGEITAPKINVSSLSAISATIGTLRTATSGARTEIKDNLIEVYDAAGTLRVQIGVLP